MAKKKPSAAPEQAPIKDLPLPPGTDVSGGMNVMIDAATAIKAGATEMATNPIGREQLKGIANNARG